MVAKRRFPWPFAGAIVLGILAGLPREASANIPVPAWFMFGLPAWMAFLTCGLLFVAIVAIEAVILKRVMPVDWRRALLYALLANLASSLVGAGLGLHIFGGVLAFLFLPVFIAVELRKRWGWPMAAAILFGFLPAVGLVVLTITFMDRRMDLSLTAWVYYGPLALAFLLTVFIEMLVIRRCHDQGPIIRAIVLSNVASYVLLVAVFVGIRMSAYENPQLSNWTLHGIATERARAGDTEGALALLRRAQARFQGPRIGLWFRRVEEKNSRYKYWARGEVSVARILIEHGDYATARALLESTQRLNLVDSSRELVVGLLARLPDSASSSSVAGASTAVERPTLPP